MTNKPLFRETALAQLTSPDQLDQLLQVTRPAAWLGLLACALLLLTAFLWGLFGSLAVNVAGQGVLLAPGGVRDVAALMPGQLVEIEAAVGDRIAVGQVVARVLEAGAALPTEVRSPYAGRVLELKAVEGGPVERGDALLSLEVAGAERLEAVLYVPAAEAGKIQPGMEVLLAPASVKQEVYGLLVGRVTGVGEFPASRQGILRVLGSEALASALALESAVVEVRVTLRSDPQTASGYAWTAAQGPPHPLTSGDLCAAWIEISVARPLSLLFSQLR